MQITVTTEDGGVFPLETDEGLTLLNLKAILAMEVEREVDEMELLYKMKPMRDGTMTLREYQVEDGDIIMLTYPYFPPPRVPPPQPLPQLQPPQQPQDPQQPPQDPQQQPQAQALPPTLPNIDWAAIRIPGIPGAAASGDGPSSSSHQATGGGSQQQQWSDPDDPEVIRNHFLSHPDELSLLRQQNPPLAQALDSGDPTLFHSALDRHRQAVRDEERRRIRMLNADPFDPEVQQRIAQDIKQKNIEENMQAAIEFTPESFSNVVMLYVRIEVNGKLVIALVDSGAAGTIMSDRCAERCNVMRLVDRRFAGMAVGVGTQRIIGKVHLGTIKIGDDFLTSSFKVLENQTEDMLLGLDMLRRHQCCIDLGKNVLRIGTTGQEVPFLTESELKDKEEARRRQEQLVMEGEDAEMAQAIATSESEKQQLSLATFPESSIEQVVAAGFSREDALSELKETGGDVQKAITDLLAKSIATSFSAKTQEQ